MDQGHFFLSAFGKTASLQYASHQHVCCQSLRTRGRNHWITQFCGGNVPWQAPFDSQEVAFLGQTGEVMGIPATKVTWQKNRQFFRFRVLASM
jgi:hypothetical protein